MSTYQHSDSGGWWRPIAYVAAFLSVLTAIIYFLIGFNVVSVLDTATDQVFGFPAGLAYALGAVLLIAVNRRVVWILGAALQVFVIYMYFNVAPQRSPDYEIWGIVLRVIQMVILVTLTYLSLRAPWIPTHKIQAEVNHLVKSH